MVRTLSSLIALALLGCAGPAKHAASTPAQPAPAAHGSASPHGAGGGPVDIRKAELPFVIYDRAGRRVDEAAMLEVLGAARAVCLGEVHRNPHHHWAQLRLFDALSQRVGDGGELLALGFEMFQAPFQDVLDSYGAGDIDERVLLARSEWRERWGTDFALYEPTLRLAVDRGHKLLALNQRKELVSKVGRLGLAGLSDEERAGLPELVLDDAEHRAWFDKVMENHPHIGTGDASPHDAGNASDGNSAGDDGAAASKNIDDVYAAQVIWDETMADNAARWLAGGDQRKLVIIAGNGHCHDSAVVRRLVRRGVEPVVSVRPAIDDGHGGADDALRDQNNDYVLVMLYE